MRLKGIWILCALALGGLALATAGCGGGGGSTTTVTVDTSTETTATESTDTTATDTTATDTTATDTTATDTTATDTTATDTTATDTTATDTTATDTTASGTVTNGLGFLTSAKCQEYLQFVSSFGSAMSGSGGTDFEKAAQAMQDSADQAPEEIQADFQTFADFYVKLAAVYKGVDMSSGQVSAEMIAKLQKLSSEVDMAKVTTASTNISNWLTKNCTGTGG